MTGSYQRVERTGLEGIMDYETPWARQLTRRTLGT